MNAKKIFKLKLTSMTDCQLSDSKRCVVFVYVVLYCVMCKKCGLLASCDMGYIIHR